jgi:putative cell wall-binding protein
MTSILRAGAVVAVALVVLGVMPARAATERRIAGADRYRTAQAVARDRWADASDVYLARGDDPADALAASFASGLHSSPVLLTQRDVLSSAAREELSALSPARVRVIGGTSAVSESVADSLRAAGYEVIRHAGGDRYETAANVARSGGAAIIGSFEGKGPTAILANGTVPFDALAAGPLAAGQLLPVLLTTPNAVPAATQSALDDLDIRQVIILGGTSAVSNAVADDLTRSGRAVRRIAGTDRMETAVAVADLIVEAGYNPTRVALVSATVPADALGAGAWAAPDTPLLLCETPTFCGAATHRWASTHSLAEVVAIGGAAVITDQAAFAVAAASG